jgi:hypothetical protein
MTYILENGHLVENENGKEYRPIVYESQDDDEMYYVDIKYIENEDYITNTFERTLKPIEVPLAEKEI